MATAKQQWKRVAVIMAGGSGERFWPLSRGSRPKQMLKLASATETLLEQAIGRVESLFPAEDIYVATSAELAPSIRAGGLRCPRKNVLAEPCKRNTAGCLAWVTAELMARYPGEKLSLAVLTADHTIGQAAPFRGRVKAAMQAAEKHAALVTIGVKPTRPETGYGYIEIAGPSAAKGVHEVARFREKPNRELAEEFLFSGRHFWNSGMFFWTAGTFLSELEQASPAHAAATHRMGELLRKRKTRAAEEEFARLEDISIDYALMEKTRNVLMVEANFSWDDVGTWDALDRSRPQDKAGNVVEGNPVLVEARNCIVVNEAGEENIAVGVVGAENLIIIVSKDAVLVAPKSRVQDVRLVARELKKRGARQV